MKTEIKKFYLENDRNNMPRLVMVDETGQEWSLSEETLSAHPGSAYSTTIRKKEDCFYLKPRKEG